ncbi:multidrug transporter [Amedibacillus sp. YH-ame6]
MKGLKIKILPILFVEVNEMKKFFIIVSIWMMTLFTIGSITAKSEIEYVIRYDSNTMETYPLKNKIQEIYTDLVGGIHAESSLRMVIKNLEMFEYKNDISAKWEDNHLLIKEGDGKGDEISGDLRAKSICAPEVEPRSFIQELFTH